MGKYFYCKTDSYLVTLNVWLIVRVDPQDRVPHPQPSDVTVCLCGQVRGKVIERYVTESLYPFVLWSARPENTSQGGKWKNSLVYTLDLWRWFFSKVTQKRLLVIVCFASPSERSSRLHLVASGQRDFNRKHKSEQVYRYTWPHVFACSYETLSVRLTCEVLEVTQLAD